MLGAHRAQLALTDEEMLETFRRVLSLRGIPQVVISTEDLRARMARWLNPAAGTNAAAAPFRSTLHPRPGPPQTYSAPAGETEEAIAGIWQAMLGISAVGRDDNFFELGGDSLLATRVAARLRETFDIELPLRCFFDAPTVAGLAALVAPEGSAPSADLAEIDSLLREIEGLTAQEVRDRLADET
jgi:acyl carrier protein